MIFKLEEIAEFQKGFAFKSKDFKKSGVKIVKVSNLTDESIDSSGCVYIDEELADNYKHYELNDDDIIITTVGSWPTNPASIVGKVVRVPKQMKGSLLNQNAVRVRSTQMVEQKYLFYLLKSNAFKDYIIGTAQGSANQASITQKDIKNFKYDIHELLEQKSIANILSTLDEKIETNNQINKKLEEMAEAIFKQWFVDFEFPNEDGEPYKSSGGEMIESEMGMIPKEWEFKKLGEICDVKGGKRLPKGKSVQDEKTKYSYLRVTDVNRGYVDMKTIKYIDEDTRKAISKYIINYDDVYISIAGTIGLVGTITRELDKASLTENMARIITHGFNKYFIKLYLNSKDGQFHISSKTVGSTQPKLPLYAIKSIPIIVADKTIYKKFSLIINSIFEKIDSNLTSSYYLGQLRDILIRKLMSGEIRVPLNN